MSKPANVNVLGKEGDKSLPLTPHEMQNGQTTQNLTSVNGMLYNNLHQSDRGMHRSDKLQNTKALKVVAPPQSFRGVVRVVLGDV